LSFLRSNGQKQSINDASLYVAVLAHPSKGVSIDDAKIQIKSEIKPNFLLFLQKSLKQSISNKRTISSVFLTKRIRKRILYRKKRSQICEFQRLFLPLPPKREVV